MAVINSDISVVPNGNAEADPETEPSPDQLWSLVSSVHWGESSYMSQHSGVAHRLSEIRTAKPDSHLFNFRDNFGCLPWICSQNWPVCQELHKTWKWSATLENVLPTNSNERCRRRFRRCFPAIGAVARTRSQTFWKLFNEWFQEICSAAVHEKPLEVETSTFLLGSHECVSVSNQFAELGTLCNGHSMVEYFKQMWSDMNSTHLERLGDLPHKVIEGLMWRWATVEIARHCLCHLRIGDWKAPLTGDLE